MRKTLLHNFCHLFFVFCYTDVTFLHFLIKLFTKASTSATREGHLGWLFKLNLHPRQHCTDDAQKAETALSAIIYIFIYLVDVRLRKKKNHGILGQANRVCRFQTQKSSKKITYSSLRLVKFLNDPFGTVSMSSDSNISLKINMDEPLL